MKLKHFGGPGTPNNATECSSFIHSLGNMGHIRTQTQRGNTRAQHGAEIL